MQNGQCTGSHSVPFFTQLSFVNLVCCLHSIHTFHPLISEDSWPRMYRITDFQTLLLMHRALHRHIMHNALRVLHAHTHRSSQPFKRFFLIVSAVSGFQALCLKKGRILAKPKTVMESRNGSAHFVFELLKKRRTLSGSSHKLLHAIAAIMSLFLPPGIHENVVVGHSKQSVWAAASKWRNLFSNEE